MEYSNPFDNPQGRFFILINAQQQFSLWPEPCSLPAGWQVVSGPDEPSVCQQWLEQRWQTLKPDNFIAVSDKADGQEVSGE